MKTILTCSKGSAVNDSITLHQDPLKGSTLSVNIATLGTMLPTHEPLRDKPHPDHSSEFLP